MTAQLSPLGVQKFYDNNGNPLSFGLLYSYAAGTTTPQASYIDSTQTTQNTNPIQLNFRGECNLWLDPTLTYKLLLTDSAGNTIPNWPVDNIPGGPFINPTGSITVPVNLIPTPTNTFTLGNSTHSWAQLYLGANASPALDTVSGIIGYYPRTAAEIAASVTPTDFAYQTYDVSRMGAVGDGSTDNTTALQNILNVAQKGRMRVHFPAQNRNGQTIYVTGPLTVSEGTYVTADPDVLIQSNNTNANLQVFQCLATLGSGTNLTANANLGATSVAVTSAAGLAAGQVVKISDSAFLVGSVPNFEHNEILSVSGTTINLKQALIGNYTTANTAQLTPHSAPARDIHFENVRVLIPTTGGVDGGSFYFQDAYNCSVRFCESQGAKGQPSVQAWRSAYVNIYGGVFRDGQNQSTPGQGYGINIAQGSHHCVAFNVEMRNVRECAVSLGARFSGFMNCVSYSPYDNGFNAHGSGSFDCFAIGCRMIGAGSSTTKGFYAGANDVRTTFIDCSVQNVSYFGLWLDANASDTVVVNFKAFNCCLQNASTYPIFVDTVTRPRILNCWVDANAVANARAAMKLNACTDAIVKGGTYRGATSGWGIIHSNCTGIQIDDCSIGNIGSAQGVQAEGTPSTSVFVRRNKVDNDTAFAKNTGDIIEFNEYNTKRQNSRGGTASVADGGTITHGCVATPYAVKVSPSVASQMASVTAIGSTTFTVAIKTDAGGAGTSQTIYWEADS